MSNEPCPSLLPDATSDKEARFLRVAAAVVQVIAAEGPDAVRYAEVARLADVSRAWLYKYFGRDRDALIAFGARTLGEAFAQQDRPRDTTSVAAWRADVALTTAQGLVDAAAAPTLVALWFRYGAAPGVAGDALRALHARHLAKFCAEMPAPLTADVARAERFAAVFTSARLGAYHLWSQPEARAQGDAALVTATLMGMVDAYLAALGVTGVVRT